jgi:hypothetical protein
MTISNAIYSPPNPILEMLASGKVVCHSRFGGILKFLLSRCRVRLGDVFPDSKSSNPTRSLSRSTQNALPSSPRTKGWRRTAAA